MGVGVRAFCGPVAPVHAVAAELGEVRHDSEDVLDLRRAPEVHVRQGEPLEAIQRVEEGARGLGAELEGGPTDGLELEPAQRGEGADDGGNAGEPGVVDGEARAETVRGEVVGDDAERADILRGVLAEDEALEAREDGRSVERDGVEEVRPSCGGQ